MKNEKSSGDASEETAVERRENEGGEILNIPAVKLMERVFLICKTPSSSSVEIKKTRAKTF